DVASESKEAASASAVRAMSGAQPQGDGMADAQAVAAARQVFQNDLNKLMTDQHNGASAATIQHDEQTLKADLAQLTQAEQALAEDSQSHRSPLGKASAAALSGAGTMRHFASAVDALFSDI